MHLHAQRKFVIWFEFCALNYIFHFSIFATLIIFREKSYLLFYFPTFKANLPKIKKKSCYILTEDENSWERKLVYQPFHENFLVVVQQKRYNEKGEWNILNHCLLPKIFVNFIAKLHEKPTTDTQGGTIFNSGGNIPPSKVPDNLTSNKILDLPENLKKKFYTYDCDMVLFFESQLGVVEACDILADLWGLALSTELVPFQPTPCTTPLRDPSPTVSSFESSLSLFSEFWDKQNSDQQSASALLDNLSGTNFETPVENRQTEGGESTSEHQKTPLNKETPRKLKNPRKRRNSTRARKLFINSD